MVIVTHRWVVLGGAFHGLSEAGDPTSKAPSASISHQWLLVSVPSTVSKKIQHTKYGNGRLGSVISQIQYFNKGGGGGLSRPPYRLLLVCTRLQLIKCDIFASYAI